MRHYKYVSLDIRAPGVEALISVMSRLLSVVGFLPCHFRWILRPALPASLNKLKLCALPLSSLSPTRIRVWLLLGGKKVTLAGVVQEDWRGLQGWDPGSVSLVAPPSLEVTGAAKCAPLGQAAEIDPNPVISWLCHFCVPQFADVSIEVGAEW